MGYLLYKKLISYWPIIFLMAIIFIFFSPFFLAGKISLPADTMVGLYHPFRDVTWDNLKSGVPFKNFLITDPVRQQYPWRLQVVDLLKNGQWPLWNSFNFSGTTLLANLQSAAFYPLNFLFWLFSFNFAWGIQIVLQLFLAGIFFYLWLRTYNVSKTACLLGSLSFIFSGFFVAWLEWNTILQSALWLPLILLCQEKIIRLINSDVKSLEQLFRKKIFLWAMLLIFAESSSFLAGHLQTFFYVVVVSAAYLLVRLWQIYYCHPELVSGSLGMPKQVRHDRRVDIKYQLILFSATSILVFLLISPQLLPTLEFIFNSARSFDQPTGFRLDWYLPWKHLVQFVAPDFFGNPATLNYWGNWNYGEFVGYIGIIPLILAVFAVLTRRDKKTFFFAFLVFLSLLLALPNVIAFIPYQLKLPFISTTAPSRLLFVTDFSLAVLAALGLDSLLKEKTTKQILFAGLLIAAVFAFLWLSIYVNFWKTDTANLLVAKRNLYLPTGLFVVGWIISILIVIARSGTTKQSISSDKKTATVAYGNLAMTSGSVLILLLLIIVSFDLMRFSQKFNPFVKPEWIFPQTKTIRFLQRQPPPFRVESLDDRIMPPNFSGAYNIETVEGYDPLINLRYAQFMAAVERNKPDISSFNFNRIITPKLYDNPFINLLNVKYFLSFEDLNLPDVQKVFQEGKTKVYQNLKAQPRAFFVNKLVTVNTSRAAIGEVFKYKKELNTTAVVEASRPIAKSVQENFLDRADVITGSGQEVLIKTETKTPRYLVLSQSLLPGWKAKIDGIKTPIYQTDFVLGGIVVPAGKHEVSFYYQPLIFFIGLANFGLAVIIIIIWGTKVWSKKLSA